MSGNKRFCFVTKSLCSVGANANGIFTLHWLQTPNPNSKINRSVYGTARNPLMGRTNFPNTYPQRLQRVGGKNSTASSNVSNSLGVISQRLFSTPSTGTQRP